MSIELLNGALEDEVIAEEEHATHAGPLSALAGEDHDKVGGLVGDLTALGLGQLGAGADDLEATVGEVVAAVGEGVGQVAQLVGHFGVVGEPVLVAGGHVLEGRARSGGEEEQLRLVGNVHVILRTSLGNGRRTGEVPAARRVDNDVGVGAAESEAVDADTLQPVLGERGGLDGDRQLALGEADLGVGRAELDVGGNCAVLERHDGLDERDETGGTLGVADVGLDRGDVNALFTKDVGDGTRLDGVTNGGTSAVALKVCSLAEVLTDCQYREKKKKKRGGG